jgi:hypothetical protein
MKLTIITCDRPETYIHKTLKSLHGQGVDTHIVAQSEKGALAPDFGDFGCTQAIVHPVSDNPRRNAATNFMYALAMDERTAPLVIAEDDVLFTRNVASKLSECIKAVPVSRYILTLYSLHRLEDYPVEHINHRKWAGSQAIYIPKSVESDLVDHFIEKLHSEFAIDYTTDIAIHSFCEEWNVPLFCCNPNLVQHIGKKSTLSPRNGFHISPTFKL